MIPRRLIPLTIALLAILALAANALAALDYPRPSGPVGDYSKVIDPAYAQRIAAASTELLQKTGVSLVVATVPSLDGASIEQAATQLFEKWGIGKKDKGLLILIAPSERKLRIEVGSGLKGTVTNAVAKAIINELMTPRLKKNQYGQALLDGVAGAAAVIAQKSEVQLVSVPQVEYSLTAERIASKAKRIASKRVFQKFDREYAVAVWPSSATLFSNPFVYKGKTLGLFAYFKEMLSESEAVFTLAGKPILISRIPSDKFRQPAMAMIAVTVLGKKEISFEIFSKISVPHLGFKGAYICKKNNCEDALLWNQ